MPACVSLSNNNDSLSSLAALATLSSLRECSFAGLFTFEVYRGLWSVSNATVPRPLLPHRHCTAMSKRDSSGKTTASSSKLPAESFAPPVPSTLCFVPSSDRMPTAGVTLVVLERLLSLAERQTRRLRKKKQKGEDGKATEPANSLLKTFAICENMVKPATWQRRCPYIDLVEEQEKGQANIFVSHAWMYDFRVVVQALKRFEELQSAKRDVSGRTGNATKSMAKKFFYWLDVVVVNQHRSNERDFDWWNTSFRDCVRSIGHTVLVLHPYRDPAPLRRAWCLWEIHSTKVTGAAFDIALSKDEEDNFEVDLGYNFHWMLEKVRSIDVKRAEATKPEDKAMILANIERESSMQSLNELVSSTMKTWLLETGRRASKRKVVDYLYKKFNDDLPRLLDKLEEELAR